MPTSKPVGLALQFALLIFFGCDRGRSPADHEQAIRQVMNDQEAAWDRGDIDRFMQGYADSVCFISPGDRTCGREQVAARYHARYVDRAAMGDLTFGIHEILLAGDAHAWLTGTWCLERVQDTVSGGFSLFWVNGPDGWQILRDHTY